MSETKKSSLKPDCLLNHSSFRNYLYNFLQEQEIDENDVQNLGFHLGLMCSFKNDLNVNKRDYDKILLAVIDKIVSIFLRKGIANQDHALQSIDLFLKESVSFLGEDIRDSNVVQSLIANLLTLIDEYFSDTSIDNHLYSYYRFLASLFTFLPANDGYWALNFISQKKLVTSIDRLFHCSNDATAILISNIFPYILRSLHPDDELDMSLILWEKFLYLFETVLKSAVYIESFQAQIIFAVFIILIQNICDSKTNSYTLQKIVYSKIEFWDVLQFSITSKFAFIRQRVYYTFGKVISWLKLSEHEILKEPLCIVKQIGISTITDMVLVFEMLEENQGHIVKPIFFKLDSILSKMKSVGTLTITSKIPNSFMMIILKCVLNHQSRFVSNIGLAQAVGSLSEYTLYLLLKKQTSQQFLKILLNHLNCPSLYISNNRDELPSTRDNLMHFFVKVWDNLTEFNESRRFLINWLSCMIDLSWSIIPVLHGCITISALTPKKILAAADIEFISKFLSYVSGLTDRIIIKSVEAILLKSCINMFYWEILSFESMSSLLCLFDAERFQCVSNEVVQIIIDITKKNDSLEKGRDYFLFICKKIIDINKLNNDEMKQYARMVVLLHQAGIICFSSCQHLKENENTCLTWSSIFHSLESLACIDNNSDGLNQDILLKSAQFSIILIKECFIFCNIGISLEKDYHLLLNYSKKCLLQAVEYLFKDICEINDLSRITTCLDVLYQFSECIEVKSKIILPNIQNIVAICYEKLIYENSVQVWLFLGWLYSIATVTEIWKIDILQKTMCALNGLNPPITSAACFKVSGCRIWKDICKKAENNYWLFSICHSDVSSKEYNFEQAMFLTNLNACPDECLLDFLTHVKEFIIKEENLSDVDLDVILTEVWNSRNRIRNSSDFTHFVYIFIEMIIQEKLMKKFVEVINKILNFIIDASYRQPIILCKLLDTMMPLFHETSNTSLILGYCSFIAKCLIFGPFPVKEQRYREEALNFILQQCRTLWAQPPYLLFHSMFSHPRVMALQVISMILTNNQGNDCITNCLIKELIRIEKEYVFEAHQKPPLYNSYKHRVQNRIWQAVLVLHEALNEASKLELLSDIIFRLLNESMQPSVRHYMEWLIVKTVVSSSSAFDLYWNIIRNHHHGISPNNAISILRTMVLLMKCGYPATEDIAIIWMPLLLQFSMSQKFIVRIHAFFTLSKLVDICTSAKFRDFFNKYDYVTALLESLIDSKNGNIPKNVEKLRNNFFLSEFHPVNHFTLETIFHDTILLFNVTSEEMIDPKCFLYNFDESKYFVKLTNQCSMKNLLQPNENEISGDAQLDTISFSNFQKKIMPWVDTLNNENMFVSRKKTSTNDGLIVVASLIDRKPNLGGLCRTCEVFGVSEYVINNISLINDKEFQSLSVSSEKWMDVKEIKTHDLSTYLMSMKMKGYTLIGAEQSEESISLNKFVFPKKSLIVLGNEKEGLSFEILSALDNCIEIPQKGIVRSLNVHVSAAVMIWEYSKQHCELSSIPSVS